MKTDPTALETRAFSRRRFLLGSGSVIFLAACGSGSTAMDGGADVSSTETGSDAGTDASVLPSGRNALWIPPTITGTTFALTLAPSTHQFQPGATTPTYAYNGGEFWGPTLIMQKGDTVHMNVTNRLTEDTTTHWHGFHLPADADGGPHQVIAAGATWSPSFEVKNNAGTFWYHPHAHMMTMKQLNLGAGGFIIVRDPSEAALGLPRTYGVDDIPLMLTSRTFQSTNEISETTIYGDHLVANGTLNAEVGLPAQFVRLRILNAEIERGHNLGFSDGRTFHVIATDGGLVNAPVPVTRLKMVPGERYEILVNLTTDMVGSSLVLQSFNSGQEMGFPGSEPQTSGEFGSLLNNTTFDVVHIQVIAATADAITTLPTVLANNVYWTAADATMQRHLSITDTGPGTPFTFDGVGYNADTINQTVTLGTTEQWTITNGRTFGHAFHIHDVQFAIVSRSTGAVPPNEQGWKDTLYIRPDESVSFVARFTDFASNVNPFMYHCHMADHEDGGLMGQFLVV